MELTITPKAEKFIGRMIRFNGGTPEHGFRLVVSPGGCSGLSSEFTVEAGPLEGDATVEASGLKLFLPAESRILLDGATIDFKDTPLESGLTFITQQAESCGCSSNSSGHGEHSGPSTVSIASIQRKH
ncbi:MAG TPA: iron-sulfur cluster assembly accessory protein [Novimethylophilus sp.]|jgi:iron-sulfur cluster assembly accessory protein|uniref:HesB/IscA family protein n=1 Tax=Novimethylophilus sp. TaxID=2137426 RepID=UPI002F409F2A